MLSQIVAICVGASLGAVLRWLLGIRFNSLFPTIPMGTLAANLIGAYIIGLAVGYFSQAPEISSEWRLLIITGFCGGLTTFSTFSAEVMTLLQEAEPGWAAATIVVHVSGSLILTFAGLFTWQLLKAT
jgi:CrcB protein